MFDHTNPSKYMHNYLNYSSNYDTHEDSNDWSGKGLILEYESDESGDFTPHKWKISPNRPLVRANQYRNLSPESKTQAIVRGQRELMEMVGEMPENCYELSLKDLVEYPLKQDNFKEDQRVINETSRITHRRELPPDVKKRLQNNRNGGGFLLKMGFPVSSLGSSNNNKKKKLNSMDPKLPSSRKLYYAEGDGKRGVDKEWWKRRYRVSEESSESGGLSSVNSASSQSSGCSSITTTTTRSNRDDHGCWALFSPRSGRWTDKRSP